MDSTENNNENQEDSPLRRFIKNLLANDAKIAAYVLFIAFMLFFVGAVSHSCGLIGRKIVELEHYNQAVNVKISRSLAEIRSHNLEVKNFLAVLRQASAEEVKDLKEKVSIISYYKRISLSNFKFAITSGQYDAEAVDSLKEMTDHVCDEEIDRCVEIMAKFGFTYSILIQKLNELSLRLLELDLTLVLFKFGFIECEYRSKGSIHFRRFVEEIRGRINRLELAEALHDLKTNKDIIEYMKERSETGKEAMNSFKNMLKEANELEEKLKLISYCVATKGQ